ncbi:hypothetical protein J5X92_10200 [Alteromonas sp. K632G]|uniref:ABC-three component system middle component 5 n=1 Tax=Alteromonas sp. K632G TaxID=2820757 RepID=UPI001AD6C6AF|nr:ABC-three component system middle component 5 [Alteromonas sp. K632G]MBO7922589.1 hypothetical protein [Alteromonas sp. K632G]
MIIYHHRNDVFNCIFRFLSIFSILDREKIEFERLKIIDFYFAFPHLLATTTIPRAAGSSKLKKFAQTLSIPYENFPSNRILFSEMGDFQSQALDILRSKEILILDDGWLSVGEVFFREEVMRLVNDSRFTSNPVFKTLVTVFMTCNLHGANGLKSKTGLMEYRYDAV